MRLETHTPTRSAVRSVATGLPVHRGWLRWLLLPLLIAALCACERNGAVVAEPEYAAALVGDWQGTVGDERETISFTRDGHFTAQLLRKGFISNTLGQGEPGTIDGTWTLQGTTITLVIESTDNVNPLNFASSNTIVSFKENELVMSSAEGATSTFIRAL